MQGLIISQINKECKYPMNRMGILRKNFGESPQYVFERGCVVLSECLIYELITHPIHNEAANGFGVYFGFHVLAYGLNGTWT